MKILALEFSSARRSAAVAEVVPGDVRILGSGTAENVRAVTGLELINWALEGARASPAEIDVIAVALGPGSYVGIRSAIALAQGWQLARDTKLLGISSADVLATAARENGIRGDVTIVIDAQRQEVYAARYELSADRIERTEALQIVSPATVASAQIFGPGVSELVPGAKVLYPSAAVLARLAAGGTDYKPGEELEPIYLRQSSFVKASPPRFGA